MGARRKVPHTTTRVLAPAGTQQRREPACVVIVNGAQLGLEARIDENPLVIGRASCRERV